MKSRREQFRAWIRTKPSSVRVLARTLKPWKSYRLKETDQDVLLRSYNENGTVSVIVTTCFGMSYIVSGYKPDKLEVIPARRAK